MTSTSIIEADNTLQMYTEHDNCDKIRILHVDDDLANLFVCKDILQLRGNFEVDSVNSVQQALEKLQKQQYDAIISDYEMPAKNGLDFLKELRQAGNEIPFVILTGKGREEIAIQALNLGADGYFNKQGNPEVVYGELAHGVKLAVDRQKAKEALIESEKRYHALMEQAVDSIFVHDINGKIIDVNQMACNSLGYTKSELLTKAIPDIDPAVDPTALDSIWRQVIAGQNATLETQTVRKNGIVLPVEVSLGSMVLNGRKVIIGNVRDVSDRKKAEEELFTSNEKLKLMYENVLDLVVLVDTKGKILDVNERVEELFGYKKEEVIGKYFNELGVLSPKQTQKIEEFFCCSARTGKPKRMTELKLILKNGKKIGAEMSSGFIKDRNDRIIGIVNIIRDITQRKKAEEELKKTNQQLHLATEKLQTVGSLTRHDVRNRMMSANGYIYLLKKRLANRSELLGYLQGIESQISQSNELLEFSAMYEKIGLEKLSNVNVDDCFYQAIKLLPEVSAVKVINQCQGLVVVADSMLSKLFYTLIDNSLKHGDKVTEIKLSYQKDHNVTKLFYEDNGVGIANENKSKIFEGYTTGGSGLGLKLAKKMIEAYGWSIVENGVPDKSARFEITIPS